MAVSLSNANGGVVSASIQNLSHPSKIYDQAESKGITVIKGVLYVIDSFKIKSNAKLIVNKCLLIFYKQFCVR